MNTWDLLKKELLINDIILLGNNKCKTPKGKTCSIKRKISQYLISIENYSMKRLRNERHSPIIFIKFQNNKKHILNFQNILNPPPQLKTTNE